MGINDAFSSWLRGAQSTLTSGLKAAQAQAAAFQAQTMTALTAAQRAVTQPFQQQTAPSSRSSSPYTAKTVTPVDLIGEAAKAAQGGARAVQQGVQQIVQAHAPIAQGLQRDVGRAVQAAPGFVRSAPVAVQQGVQQIVQAHAPIAQGLQRDVGRAVQAAPGFVRSAPVAVQQGVQQIVQAHAPIAQGLQRDVGRAVQAAPGFVRSASVAAQARSTPALSQQQRTPTSSPFEAATRATSRQGTPPISALTPQQQQERYARYQQDVERFNASPAHSQLPGLLARRETAAQQYGINPELRRYEQQVAAYNAQLDAHQRAMARGKGQQATAERLQLMQQELASWGGRIETRMGAELAGIRKLDADIETMRTPLETEYRRLQREEQALKPVIAAEQAKRLDQLPSPFEAATRAEARTPALRMPSEVLRDQRPSTVAEPQQGGGRVIPPINIGGIDVGGIANYWLATPDRTKPIFDFGQDVSRWWTRDVAPAIKGGIDQLPYLGPATSIAQRPGPSGVGGRSGDERYQLAPGMTRGEWATVPAGPLTGGGTRLKPNWQGDIGHDFAKGALVNFPRGMIEFVTAAPLGLERLGGALLDDPGKAMVTLGGGFGMVAGGMVESAKENPAEFAGEMAGGLLMGRLGGLATRGVRSATITVGEGTGLVRKQTYGFGGKPGTNPVQYMSRAESLQTVLENPRVSGVRATSAPVGTFSRETGLIPIRKMQIRNPGTKGDTPAGQSVSAEGIFMALSRPGLIEPYGTWFTKGGTQRGGLRGQVLGGRVYLHENVRTVQIPKSLKDRIYNRVRETGEFWGEDYDTVLKLAQEQSKKYGEPIAVPSPKRARGNWEPENEAFLVFAGDTSRKITGTQFAGFSSDGTLVKRITLGRQAPITQTRLGSVAENLQYNWDLGRDRFRVYNRNLLEAQTKDMARKKGEIYEGELSYPGEYARHGLEHAHGVERGLMDQFVRSPTLQQTTTPPELRLRAKYHDIAKIGDADTQPYPHGWAAGTAIRKGMIQDPDLLALPKKTQIDIGRDIQLHTDIQPTLPSLVRYRPSVTAKALATADRLDLARFGVSVKQSKIFPIPEETLGFRVGQVADRLPIGFQVRFLDAPPPAHGKIIPVGAGSDRARPTTSQRTATPPLTSSPSTGVNIAESPYALPVKSPAKTSVPNAVMKEGYSSRPYPESYAAPPYGGPYPESYAAPPYGGPYPESYAAPPYGGPYPEPYAAPPYGGPYPEPYAAPPYGGPYPEPYAAPPYDGPYPEPYAAPPYDGPYPGEYPETPISPPYPSYGSSVGKRPQTTAPPKTATKKPKTRRRKLKKYNPHWELGPAPGTEEMAGMIFGSGRGRSLEGSVLDFGAPSIGVTGAPPAPAPGKNPAHAEPPRRQPDAMDLLYGGLGRRRDLAPAAKKKR